MQDLDPGRGNSSFPATRPTLVDALRGADPAARRAALAGLIAAYWRPACAYLRWRRGRSAADAEDLVQGFFARELEREFLQAFDPAKARFRTFLRLCLDRHAQRVAAADSASKRGGGVLPIALERGDAESSRGERVVREPASEDDVDEFFTREWRRAVFSSAIERLAGDCRAAGQERRFTIFEAIDLADAEHKPAYAELATRLGLPVTTINNELASARRELRRIVIDLLRAQCCDETDFREQFAALLGGSA